MKYPARPWFAWHPVNTQDQGWIWLMTVHRYLEYYSNPDGPESGRYWNYFKHKENVR